MVTPDGNFDNRERMYPLGGDGGSAWHDWSKVQQMSIAPPLSSIEEAVRRANLSAPYAMNEAETLQMLTRVELSDYCANRGILIRHIQEQEEVIADILAATEGADDDELLTLSRAQFPGVVTLPRTRADLINMLSEINNKRDELYEEIDEARAKGVFFDTLPLIEWFETPPAERTSDSPATLMGFFGQRLFDVAAISAENTTFGHIQAIGSRQIAPKFGGEYDENEKTRYTNVPQYQRPNPTQSQEMMQ